jgi:hypothetical protein
VRPPPPPPQQRWWRAHRPSRRRLLRCLSDDLDPAAESALVWPGTPSSTPSSPTRRPQRCSWPGRADQAATLTAGLQDPKAAAGQFGFGVNNTIGGTPQPNAWMDSWVDFYRERRLRHQLKLAGGGVCWGRGRAGGVGGGGGQRVWACTELPGSQHTHSYISCPPGVHSWAQSPGWGLFPVLRPWTRACAPVPCAAAVDPGMRACSLLPPPGRRRQPEPPG